MVKGGDRAGKRRGRRAYGIQVAERHGHWHVKATVRAGGRSIRIRQSLGLAVADSSRDQALAAADEYVAEIRARAEGKSRRGARISAAALDYLGAARERPLKASSVNIIKAIAARFRDRHLNEIRAEEWRAWIDGDTERGTAGVQSGNASASRERFLNGVVAFLNYCKQHHGLAAPPAFRRDRKATNPNRRARRRVEDLRPDLIKLLFDHAQISTRAQLALEVATGARVSSVLHGARLCDLDLERAQITFRKTKSGADVLAVLDPTTVEILKQYLAWRGGLHRRDDPLFLTPRKRQPYSANGLSGQNRAAFNGTKARAIETIRQRAAGAARAARAAGDLAGAAAIVAAAAADAELVGKVTQHWFRHRLATLWIRRDPRAAMEQGGWLDIRSIMGYSHDAPEFRRQVAAELDPFTVSPVASTPPR